MSLAALLGGTSSITDFSEIKLSRLNLTVSSESSLAVAGRLLCYWRLFLLASLEEFRLFTNAIALFIYASLWTCHLVRFPMHQFWSVTKLDHLLHFLVLFSGHVVHHKFLLFEKLYRSNVCKSEKFQVAKTHCKLFKHFESLGPNSTPLIVRPYTEIQQFDETSLLVNFESASAHHLAATLFNVSHNNNRSAACIIHFIMDALAAHPR